MITKEEVKKAQSDWASGIVEIGKTKGDPSKCKKLTKDFLYNLYDFREGSVQFKPTRASINQFRNNLNAAMSYFIANNKSFSEDKGFALTPWKEILFENDSIILHENIATAMGNYYFKDKSGKKIKVEYTLGYIKRTRGEIKIILHHSSLPYNLN